MIHSPKLSEAYTAFLREMFPRFNFQDVSYSNDCMDSIASEDRSIQVFLPNIYNPYRTDHPSKRDDEQMTHFGVNLMNKDKEEFFISHEFNLNELMRLLDVIDVMGIEFDGERFELFELLCSEHESWDEILAPQVALEIGGRILVGVGEAVRVS